MVVYNNRGHVHCIPRQSCQSVLSHVEKNSN